MAKGSGRVILLLVALLGAAGRARASEQSPGDEGFSEVVVTARFKSETLQTAPIAITAVSADQIDARGYVNVADVARAAPNVNIEQAGSGFGKSAFVSIRGIGQNDFKYTFEPGVGFYIDDVYFGTVFGSVFDLTDIDSVEPTAVITVLSRRTPPARRSRAICPSTISAITSSARNCNSAAAPCRTPSIGPRAPITWTARISTAA
jgi:hypothetical protein